MLTMASAGKATLAIVAALIGVLILAFNGRVARALVTGNRETLGMLLGRNRKITDRLFTSRAFVVAARLFLVVWAIVWIGLAVSLAVKAI